MPDNIITFLNTYPWIIAIVILWTIPWKGVALWRAARNQSVAWFVVLLIINTLGILEIIYIFAFSKKTEVGIEMSQPVEEPRIPKPEKIVLDIKREEKSDLDESVPKS